MNLLIAIAGLVAIFAIEVRELPDVDEPVVNVRANLPGASRDHGRGVTRILEGAVARVSGVKEVNSNSEEEIPVFAPFLILAPMLIVRPPMSGKR